MGFSEILENLKMNGESWSPRTLSLYLDGLEKDNCIRRVPRGKRKIYSVLKGHPEVDSIIGRRIIVSGRIELKSLSEKELLDSWIESIKFALLNIFQCYMEIGRGKKILRSIGNGKIIPIENLLGEYFSDLISVCHSYGGFLVDGIKRGNLEPEIVWKARNEILEEIKRKRKTK